MLALRPAGEARALLTALRGQGADAVNLPLLRLRARPARLVAPDLAAVQDADTWIFSSPAAVRMLATTAHRLGLADALFGAGGALARQARLGRIFAPGPGTAQALERRGVAPVNTPARRLDSEGLLALPTLAAPWHARTVIVGGEGGRGLLQRSLAQRGANVATLDLYRRLPAPLTPTLRARLSDRRRKLLIASSTSMLARLAESLPAESLNRLAKRVPIVLASERLAEAAAALGFCRRFVAGSARPEALVQAAIAIAEPFSRASKRRDSVSMAT